MKGGKARPSRSIKQILTLLKVKICPQRVKSTRCGRFFLLFLFGLLVRGFCFLRALFAALAGVFERFQNVVGQLDFSLHLALFAAFFALRLFCGRLGLGGRLLLCLPAVISVLAEIPYLP